MIKMYAFKHTFLGVSGQIIFDDHEPEAYCRGQKIALERAVYEDRSDFLKKMKDLDLYYLGSYDDEKMILYPDKKPLLSCKEIIEAAEFRKGVSKDESKEKKESVSDLQNSANC